MHTLLHLWHVASSHYRVPSGVSCGHCLVSSDWSHRQHTEEPLCRDQSWLAGDMRLTFCSILYISSFMALPPPPPPIPSDFILFHKFCNFMLWWDAVLQKRLAWALFVLSLSTLVFCQLAELISGFFLFHKFCNWPPTAGERRTAVSAMAHHSFRLVNWVTDPANDFDSIKADLSESGMGTCLNVCSYYACRCMCCSCYLFPKALTPQAPSSLLRCTMTLCMADMALNQQRTRQSTTSTTVPLLPSRAMPKPSCPFGTRWVGPTTELSV